MFLSYLLVFVLASIPLVELAAVIPLAVIGGLHPAPAAILAFLGNALTVFLLIVFIDRVKKWLKKRKEKRIDDSEKASSVNNDEMQNSKKGKRARLLFDKYGLPGLAIIGPFFVGSHVSAFMGMSFGSGRRMVIIWMFASLLLWTVIITVASIYGTEYFIPNVKEDGFLIRLFQN